MRMYVYADVVFIINVMMNSAILLLTAWTTGIKYKLWRILLAASIGSLYVLVSIIPGMLIVHHIIFKILMSLILILLAFGIKPKRLILLIMAFFYMIAFILGGAVAGWLYFSQSSNYFGSFDIIQIRLS